MNVEAYLPHRGTMLLLTEILDASPESFAASVVITPASTFYEPGAGVPSYAGIEYMAQTIAAGDGAQRHAHNQSPEIGFLLGTRRYQATQDYFRNGDRLIIRVQSVFVSEGMGAFDCTIHVNGDLCAEATLNVFRPPTPDESA